MEKNGKINKICFVSPFAYSLFNSDITLKFGGSEVQMYNIAKELARDSGFDVNFIVLDVGQQEEETYNNVKLFRAHKRGRNLFNLIWAPFKLFNTLKKINPDTVVSRAYGVEAGICAFWAKKFKKKFIYSIAHDKDIDGSFFKSLRGKIFKYGFLRADLWIAQNENQKEEFVKRYNNFSERISIIKNSFEIKEGEEEKKEFIFWVGSSADMKRPKVFLDLARDFPEEKFVMVATKSKVNLSLWDEIYKESEKISNLEFLETIPFAKIDEYFKKSKIFVSTASHEGFPNVFLQAAIFKIPILSLKVDPDGFIEKNKCGFICEDSFEKLESNLKSTLENESLQKEMGENGHNYVKREHNIEENIKKWKEILNK